jgi:ElaB/YqjD/DUF883 family membrane-anchored ribosome-binding protein
MPASTYSSDDLREEAAKRKEGIKENIEGLAENAGRYARKVMDETHHVSDKIGENADTLAGIIREQPVKASLIALAVGTLFGMLLRRH